MPKYKFLFLIFNKRNPLSLSISHSHSLSVSVYQLGAIQPQASNEAKGSCRENFTWAPTSGYAHQSDSGAQNLQQQKRSDLCMRTTDRQM